MPLTYIPAEQPGVMDPPVVKEEEFSLPSSDSNSSLLNSISSTENPSDSEDELICKPSMCCYDDCGDDPFASLDAEYNKLNNEKQVSCNGLMRCCSVYEPSISEPQCSCSTEKRVELLVVCDRRILCGRRDI